MRFTLLFCLFTALLIQEVPAQSLYRVNSGTKEPLRAIFFVDDSNGIAVGDSATELITQNGGVSWHPLDLSTLLFTTPNFYSVYFLDLVNGHIAGDSGTIVNFLNGTPSLANIPGVEVNLIYGMTFPSFDTGVVCGASGLFCMTTNQGVSWRKISLPTTAQKLDFHGTDYFDDDTYWLVGQNGMVLYTKDDGETWQHIPVPTSEDLYSIIFPDSSGTGWIVGDKTLLVTLDGGDTWSSIPTSDSLRFVSGWDSTDAYAVGLHGAIDSTSDRTDWYPVANGTTTNLYGFSFTDDYEYYCGDSGIILTTMAPSSSLVEPYDNPKQSIILMSGNQNVYLTISKGVSGLTHLELFNLMGVRVFSDNVAPFESRIILRESLSSGVYFYRLDDGEMGKFIME